MAENGISGLHKTAIFLLSLGEDLASEVLRHLSEDEIRRITSTMYELNSVPGDQTFDVLQEFSKSVSSSGETVSSTRDYVQHVLQRTVGNDRAQSMMRHISFVYSPQKTEDVATAMDLDSKTLARLIGDEHPQVIALILSYMDSKLTSKALGEMSDALQAEVISRMAGLGEVPPDVMEEVQNAFQRKVQEMGVVTNKSLDGMEVTTQLLNSMDRETGNAIMEKIKEIDSELAENIKQRMFTFEDLAELDDRTMQVILANIDTQSLGVALKGASKELQEKVFSNLSQRAGDMLKEDMEAMGPVKRAEVYKTQQEIIESTRQLETEGKIEISMSEEDLVY